MKCHNQFKAEVTPERHHQEYNKSKMTDRKQEKQSDPEQAEFVEHLNLTWFQFEPDPAQKKDNPQTTEQQSPKTKVSKVHSKGNGIALAFSLYLALTN